MRRALNQLGAVVALFALPVAFVAVPWQPESSGAFVAQVVVMTAAMLAGVGLLIVFIEGSIIDH